MDGYEEQFDKLAKLGVAVIGASVDERQESEKLAENLSFPLAYAVTRQDADRLGAFWDESKNFIQPTEFILKGSKVVASTYSSSPVGRIRAEDAVTLIQMLSKAQG